LHEDSKEMEQHETKIDVSGYRDRNPFGNRGPIYVPGVKVVVSIPYTGDTSLWNLRPNRSGSVFPRADIRQSNRDEIGYLDIMIAHLNGHYEGGATGETFRRSGKTDIRIEDQERAAFVAECKVWRGHKELLEAVDQLLSYLTWRDCKAAIIVFNKHNAKFTELLTKVSETVRSHLKFKKELGQQKEGEWRFILTSLEDELRQVIVNVFVFNLFVA